MRNISLAVDIGGSKYIVGFVDESGHILCKKHYLWEKLDKDSVISSVLHGVKTLQEEYPDYHAAAVGATIPGLADPKTGLWVEASFSGIRNLPIAEILSKELKVPAFADNDTRACALAEKMFGVCKKNTDFIWITVSNGIGGALFLDNRLYWGGYGNAGEIGHVVVCEKEGRRCKCGSVGCLEVHAAGPAIVKNYLEIKETPEETGVEINAKVIEALARRGEKAAVQAYELEGYFLGKTIASIANILNPQKVVIGGGVSMAFDLFKPELERTVQKMIYNYANSRLIIERTGLGYEAALVGAASLAFRGIGLL